METISVITPKKNNKDVKEASCTAPTSNVAGPADFEVAIEMAGFGLFNYLLLAVSVIGLMSNVFESTAVSYVLPSAECDLKLSLLDKGLMNGITYVGMIISALPWGYIADTRGRKKTLYIGYLLDVICVLGAAASQSALQLMIFKFLGGIVMSGPFAVIISYISELHGKKYRPPVMMLVGMMFAIASLLLPVLALTILPHDWTFHLLGLKFRSWQIFLAVCGVPSLLSGFLVMFFPESPKFLMSQGRNAEALKVFETVYAINHRNSNKTPYPIKTLVNEVKPVIEEEYGSTTTASTVEAAATTCEQRKVLKKPNAVRQMLIQLRPLFVKPYLSLSLQVYLMNFCILLGQNTMRLWLPQLFTSINEFEILEGPAGSMCEILEYSRNKTFLNNIRPPEECTVVISAEAYQNNVIVAVMGLCAYIIVSWLVNYFDVKHILNVSILLSCCCGIGIYFSPSSLVTVIVASLYTSGGSIAATSVISSSVNLFPTTLRTIIVALSSMTGRSGSIIGNLLFPQFITLGCIPPFMLVSSAMLIAFVISLFLPKSNKISLK